MYYTVYKTTCLINGKIYVGKHQTKKLNDGYLGSGKRLLHAIKKYGKENFKVERILLNNEDEMDELESLIVDEKFLLRKDIYNLKLGGEGGFTYINSSGIDKFKGKKHTLETKLKIAMLSTGRKLSPEARQKISDRNKITNAVRGKKVSLSLKNKKKTEEHKRKISESLRENWSSKPFEKHKPRLSQPDIIEFWHPTKNKNLKINDINIGYSKKVWWLCKNNHNYKRTVRGQTKYSQCPKCNSLGFKYSKISESWHPTKNKPLTPFDVSCGTNKKVWWICEKGHEYEQRIDSKTYKGYGCPKCAGRK